VSLVRTPDDRISMGETSPLGGDVTVFGRATSATVS
jgi:hypothetical protein